MLDALHARLVRSRALQRFTAFTRVLLAVGFAPPGLKKVLGIPFTSLGPDDPIGLFFAAFFQAEAFYVFVGLGQVAAALLLLWPRTATLGAVLYFPIIVVINAVTWSIGFGGTRWITLLMTLACAWLLVWDWDRLRAILPRRPGRRAGFGAREYAVQIGVWGGGGLALAVLASTVGTMGVGPALALFAGGGAGFGALVAWHLEHLDTPV